MIIPFGFLKKEPPPAGGTFPAYVDSGAYAGVTSTSTISVDFTATVNNDILILRVATAGSATWTTPSGWALIGTDTSSAASVTSFWLRSDGTETGSIDVVSDNTFATWGKMDRFSDCKTTGTPYEEYVTTGWANDTGQSLSNNLASNGKSLAVIWYTQEDNAATTDLSSGYTEQYAQSSNIGTDSSFHLSTEQLETTSTVDGNVQYTTAGDSNTLFGVILIPV